MNWGIIGLTIPYFLLFFSKLDKKESQNFISKNMLKNESYPRPKLGKVNELRRYKSKTLLKLGDDHLFFSL